MSQVPERRAVVLTRSVGGLLAGAWLAERGVDVRVLCLPGVGSHAHGVHRVAPEVASWAERFLGGLVRPGDGIAECWHSSEGWRTAHDVAIGAAFGALEALTAEAISNPQLATVRAHLRALTGVQPELVPTRLLRNTHGSHQELRVPLQPTASVMESLAERVRDAGGDVLDDVEIEELDVLDGKVMGVWSDHGLEHVEEVLWTDLDEATLRSLGAPLPTVTSVSAEELVVELDVEDVDALPALGWFARAGVPVSRLERSALFPQSGQPWTRIRVWLTAPVGDARTASASDLEAWLQAVLQPLLGAFAVAGLQSRCVLAWPEHVETTPELKGWLTSRMVALPGALPGSQCGVIPTAEWLMRLEGRPPAASTQQVLL